jgi:ATP-dependent DNA helicase RecQ
MQAKVLSSADLVVFDLETTDKDSGKAEIIELAALQDGREFHRYLETKNKLRDDLYAFQHIPFAEYEKKKIPARDALQEFLEFIGDAPLCGHNVYEYDLPILTRALKDAELPTPSGMNAVAVDTLRWAHLLFPTPPESLLGYSVGHLFHFITKRDMQDAHLALEDCKATREVLEYLIGHPPSDTTLLRLWKRLDLPESRFYSDLPLENSELRNGLEVGASVAYLNSAGLTFPATADLFPEWVRLGLEQKVFTLKKLNAALDDIKDSRMPTGFQPFEIDSLRAMQKHLPKYRPPQGEMAHMVTAALEGKDPRAMIQAPTGTGKTKGYIFPALHHQSLATSETIIIATHTKVLQQQAMGELTDIAAKGFAVKASNVKSARDSICTEALEESILEYLPDEDDAFRNGGASRAVLVSLIRKHEFDLESLPFRWQASSAFREVRFNVQTVSSRCRDKCPFFKHCAYQTDQRQRDTSNLWITNQAYLLSRLAQPRAESNTESVEEKAFHLVIDEAHNLEDVATNSFTKVSRSEDVLFHIRKLFDERTRKGVLASNRLEDGVIRLGNSKLTEALGENTTVRDLATHVRQRLIPEALTRFAEYDREMTQFVKQHGKGELEYGLTYTLKATQTPEWMRLIRFERFWREAMSELQAALFEFLRQVPAMKYKLEPSTEFFKAHNQMLQDRLEATKSEDVKAEGELEPEDDWLYLTTLDAKNHWEHVAQPIDLKQFLKPLWERAKSVTLTSATLLPGADNEFQYFTNVLYLSDIQKRRLEETLPYNRAHIVLPSHLPEARMSSMEKFQKLHQEELKNLLPQISRSLNLFTARSRLEKTKRVLEEEASIVGILHAPLTRRERESVSQALSDVGKRADKAVALGTRAFMEGVDFYDLNLVALERIPFPTPTPLLQKRQALIEQREGRDAAWNYYLGKALLTFTQAFGRLIRDDRSQSGNGAFVVWDKRLLSATYYFDLLEALPNKFHKGDQVYLPKSRIAFYEYLQQILGVDFTGFEDTLVDKTAKDLLELREKWVQKEISLEDALAELMRLFWNEGREIKPKQREAIDAALGKRDALVLLPTGYGKSMTFQAPAILEGGLTIVISPLIALMKDQVQELLARGAPVAAIYSGMPGAEQRSILEQAERGEVNLLYLSPERINKNNDLEQVLRRLAKDGQLKRLVYDEAHCLSDWGHDFRPDYLRVKSKIAEIVQGHLPTACLTATATQQVQDDLEKSLKLKAGPPIRDSSDRSNIEYYTERFVGQRDDRSKLISTIQIIQWAENTYGEDYAIIIYVATRKKAESVARALSTYLQQPIKAYHGGLSAIIRSETQDSFMEGASKVIVATNAFGMGVDKKNVRAVIHFQPPSNIPAYIQEAGRAGRDEKPAYAILMHSSSDWNTLTNLGSYKKPETHHAGVLLEFVTSHEQTLRTYREHILKIVNDAFESDENKADLDLEAVLWLLNTMQQSGLIEYAYGLGKARLLIGDWSLLADLSAENLKTLQQLGVSSSSKARQHWLDFTQVSTQEANALGDALHELRRQIDNPSLLFSTFEPCIEITVGNQNDLSEFQGIIDRRFQQRKVDIEAMKRYANGKGCKREALLKVFSEPVDPNRDGSVCCGYCNHGDIEKPLWSKTLSIKDEEIVQILKPNRAILEFLRDHRKERLAWIERKRKTDPSMTLEYSGIGVRRISMVLRGVESEFVGKEFPVQLKWYESNTRHFGSLIGATHDEIEKAIQTLAGRKLMEQSTYEQGYTYRISDYGLQELEKRRTSI